MGDLHDHEDDVAVLLVAMRRASPTFDTESLVTDTLLAPWTVDEDGSMNPVVERVQRALDRLKARGWVENVRATAAEGSRTYRLCDAGREVANFV